jgi:viologen exporter family transport system permease protein
MSWRPCGIMPGEALRLYWEVAVRGYRRFATYRAATFAGVFTNTIFGFLRAYVFMALYTGRANVGGFNLSDTLTYTFLAQGIIMVIYLWGWWEIALTVRSGDIVTDFSRPFDYQLYWLSQDLGRAAYHAVFRGIPPFILGAIVFHLRLPQYPWTWAAFVLSLALAATVSFGFRFMLNLAAFWLFDYRGVGTIMTALWTFFSGFAVPIAFFPGALQTISRALPFAAMVNSSVEIFLEKQTGLHLLSALLFQAAWAAVVLLAGRLVLRAALKRVVVQGG